MVESVESGVSASSGGGAESVVEGRRSRFGNSGGLGRGANIKAFLADVFSVGQPQASLASSRRWCDRALAVFVL